MIKFEPFQQREESTQVYTGFQQHIIFNLLISTFWESSFSQLIIFIKLMPRWDINLHPNHNSASVQRLEQQLCLPFGFAKEFTVSSVQLPRRRDMLQSKLFDVATASKSQILMTLFMFWMFGNNISIFVLFPIIQTLMSAVGGFLNMGKVFEPYEGMLPSLFKYKFMYAGINLILFGIVLYKMSAMGMLPVLAADYVDLVPTFDTFKVMAQA